MSSFEVLEQWKAEETEEKETADEGEEADS
jgi:hypothetical protein